MKAVVQRVSSPGVEVDGERVSDGAMSFRLVREGIGAPRLLELATFRKPPQSSEPSRR